MPTLDFLREEIDNLDAELVKLLNRRAELALEVKKAKSEGSIAVYSPDRELQIFERVARLGAGGAFPPLALQQVFRQIVGATRSLVGDISVAYPGTEFSLEHDAAVKQFGEGVRFSTEASIDDAFARVERGEATFAVLPARTGAAGFVYRTFDLLIKSKLQIIAENTVSESLAMFSRAASASRLSKILADAYFFERCSDWLQSNVPSAELILEQSLERAVAKIQAYDYVGLIASETNAQRHSLPILVSGIENVSGMEARFLVVGQNIPAPTGRDKTSLICSVKERSGALHDLLKPFAENGITLLKIESQPMQDHAWEYGFFIDFVGHQFEAKIQQVLKKVAEVTTYQKILGSYPQVCHS